MVSMSPILLLPVFLIIRCNADVTDITNRCSRQKSRIVRNVINSKLVLPFQTMEFELPGSCPLVSHGDIYRIQEGHKFMEHISKWNCGYCGKSFIGEEFLDRHFDNRHSLSLKINNNTICLADYCDIFRCDIISGLRKPDFWDYALCMEDDMKESLEECTKLIDICMPNHITANETEQFKALVQGAVCSFLSCSKYWEMPKAETPDGKIAIYIVLILLLAFALLVYYCVFYQFYYTDTFSDSIIYDTSPRGKHRMFPMSEIRQRVARLESTGT